MNSFRRKLLIGLIILAILSPLGIILPSLFHSKQPFAEAPVDSVKKEMGYEQKELINDSKSYSAPLEDYELGNTHNSILRKSIYYLISGMGALLLIGAGTYWLQKNVKKNE